MTSKVLIHTCDDEWFQRDWTSPFGVSNLCFFMPCSVLYQAHRMNMDGARDSLIVCFSSRRWKLCFGKDRMSCTLRIKNWKCNLIVLKVGKEHCPLRLRSFMSSAWGHLVRC
jgi:hypothetical protein